MKTSSSTRGTSVTTSWIFLESHDHPEIRTSDGLIEATREGLFSPITAEPSDPVFATVNPDGTACIVVIAVTMTASNDAGSES